VTTRREQTSTESRELILMAAADLFAAKGYRQTTFADVAERSGISRGSIPWHFSSKEGLLLAVLERSLDMVNATFEAGPGSPDQMVEGLEALFTRPTTKLFVTLLVEAMKPDSPIHDRYVAIHDTLRGHCRRWLGPSTPQADSLAVVIVGAAIGIHQQWLLAPDRVDLRRSLTALRTLVTGTAP